MSIATPDLRPRLRPLDVRPYEQDGQPFLLLRDNLLVSQEMLLVPQPLAPVLSLCDGSWSLDEMHRLLALHYQLDFPDGTLPSLIDALDEALFLDNDRFAEARARVSAAYRAAPFRMPTLAGQSYPAEREALARELDQFLAEAGDVPPAPAEARGLVSPHIDYARGAAVYARAWKRAAAMAQAAELVVLIGTDHYSDEAGSVTLTQQNYATPYGILPTESALVDRLAEAVGAEAAYRGELRHRGEHSLELVAVWLHHMRGGRPVPLVPVLVGSFAHFVQDNVTPGDDPKLRALLETLRRETAGRRTLFLASGDLSHVGPAFGGPPLDAADKDALQADDSGVVARMCAGDAEGFYRVIQQVGDRNNVCGLSPVYLTLKLLGDTEGERVAYAVCPADGQNTSVVTVCGVVLE